ncbi:FAD/NAD(P)-binding domain-containing protein, partial [Aspergillus sclerotioniger CBS 115572]
MKIVIVGGGISGCVAYLALRKHLPRPPPPAEDHEFTIYEAYDANTNHDRSEQDTHSSTPIIGGGLGIAPNGLHVLERLDSDLLHEIVQGGYMVDHSNVKTKHGHLLMRLSSSTACLSPNNPLPMHLLGTSRHNLWQALHRRIPEDIIINKRVVKVTPNTTGPKTLTFADDSPPVSADVVIGADGLKSITKRALFPEATEDPYSPHYENLISIGGFLPTTSLPPTPPGSMNLLFSATGFFGYFYANSSPTSPHRSSPHHISPPGDTLAWWTTYSMPTPTPTPTPPDLTSPNLNLTTLTQHLHTRYSTWTDPTISTILPTITIKTIYPVFTSPPLPTFSSTGIILIGDAAHTLPPTSGQGASQALEDVEVLSLFLKHYLGISYHDENGGVSELEAVSRAGEEYTSLRRPRVQGILERAEKMQGLKRDSIGWLGGRVREWMMYLGMWLMGWFPGLVGWGMGLRGVVEYDLPWEVERVL